MWGRGRGCATLAVLVLVLALALGASPSRSEPLAVIVSSRWDRAKGIELRDLRDVYLGSRTFLFGERVHRVDLPPGSAARAGFSRSVLGRSEDQLERYWIEQALSGGALPPRQVGTPEDVIVAVRERVGTLGYVPASALEGRDLSGVRAIPLIVHGRRLDADDPDYPVRSLD